MKKLFKVFLVLSIFGAMSLRAQDINWNGGTLPQPNGGGNVPHPSGPGSEHHQGTPNHSSGNHGNNSNNYPDQPKPDGTPYPGYPHVVWNGDGRVRPETGYDWKIPGDAIASKYKVVPITARGKIAEILPNALRSPKDRRIRKWIGKVNCQFSDRAAGWGLSPWASDNCLVFSESFLGETEATRENLIAFESGKLFFTLMKGKTVKGGKTLEVWFAGYELRHDAMIMDMKNARSKDQNEDFPWIGDRDPESMFGYVFRMQALQLNMPKDKKTQDEWNKALREFRAHVNPLLRSK